MSDEEGEGAGAGAGTGEGEGEGTWYGDDWRQQIAGDDEKQLTQLGRYKTPADVWNKARALEQRITSGELKDTSPFPGEGTDEEKSAWRGANGVPESFDKYELTQDLDDDGKAILEGFLQHAHANNYDTDLVNGMVDYFISKYDTDTNASGEADAGRKAANEDALRAEWGPDFRGHMNRIDGLLDMVGEGKGTEVLEARMADGTMLRDSPEAMNFLLEAALSINPATALTPSGDMGTIDSIEDEILAIKAKMPTKEYKDSPKMQERYRTLITARENINKRSAATA